MRLTEWQQQKKPAASYPEQAMSETEGGMGELRYALLTRLLLPVSYPLAAIACDAIIRHIWRGQPWYYDVLHIVSLVVGVGSLFYATFTVAMRKDPSADVSHISRQGDRLETCQHKREGRHAHTKQEKTDMSNNDTRKVDGVIFVRRGPGRYEAYSVNDTERTVPIQVTVADEKLWITIEGSNLCQSESWEIAAKQLKPLFDIADRMRPPAAGGLDKAFWDLPEA